MAELRIAAVVLFLNALNGVQSGALAGFEAFRTIAQVNLVRGVLTLPISVGVGVYLWNLHGAVAALAATAAIAWILNHIAIRAECRKHGVPIRWEKVWRYRMILWRFSLPAFLGSALTMPSAWAASYILVHEAHGFAEMGIFSAASQWGMAVTFLPSLLSQPLLSMLSSLSSGNSKSFRTLLRSNLLFSFGMAAFAGMVIIFCSTWIMKTYGPAFSSGRRFLILLVVAAVISSTASVIGQAIASVDKMWGGFT